MTPEEINALPQRVRDYIHWIETDCDPQGTLRENFRLRKENKGLRDECTRLTERAEAAERERDEARTTLVQHESDIVRLANELAASEAHVERMREAAKPFVKEADGWSPINGWAKDDPMLDGCYISGSTKLTVGDLRRIRDASGVGDLRRAALSAEPSPEDAA